MKRSKWLTLESDTWSIVIPEHDIEAHSTSKCGKRRELAWSKCPCQPRVNWENRMIIHNSFAEKLAVEEALKSELT